MTGTREVMIGKTKVIVNNVPEHYTDEEIKDYAIKCILIEQMRKRRIKEMYNNGIGKSNIQAT